VPKVPGDLRGKGSSEEEVTLFPIAFIFQNGFRFAEN
jgi:hypothetical protein